MVPHSSHAKSCGYRWRIRAIVKPERSRRLIGVTNHVGAAISREKRPARQQAGPVGVCGLAQRARSDSSKISLKKNCASHQQK